MNGGGRLDVRSSRGHALGARHYGWVPLTLVLGPANSAKAGEVLAFAAASGRGAILVVPTAPDAAYYARELAANGAVLGSVLTFSGLAREVANRAGYTGRRLTPLQRERVLERARLGTGFDALRDAAGTAGFPGAAGELIAELERSLVTPQRFAAAMRTWAEQNPRRAGYARDVAAIYQAYAAALERGSAGSTASCTPGGRSTPCGPRPAGGDRSRCSSTGSTTCTRSSATRSRRSRAWSAPRSPCR